MLASMFVDEAVETLRLEEVEAAMCIWEYALLCRIEDDDSVYNFLRCGEGASKARLMCIDLAMVCEEAYNAAFKAGFDDSFDWEFVPMFVRAAMKANPAEINNLSVWAKDVGIAIYALHKAKYG